RRDRVLDPGRYHRERAVGVRLEGPRIDQGVELERDALAVGLGDAEADGAEAGGEERRVHGPRHVGAQRLLVHEVLEGPESGDVRLRLLQRAVGLLQLLEEAKADISGLWALQYLVDKKTL